MSAGSKSSSPQRPLTSWRAKHRHCQQGQNPADNGTHSQTGEPWAGIVSRIKIQLIIETHSPTGQPRTGIVSRVQIQITSEATHVLENQVQALSAGPKSSLALQPLLTFYTGVVSRVQMQQGSTHPLDKSQPILLGQSLCKA